MEQRERFIRDHRLALYTMTELSARYGISRKTGYKWLDRFDQGGREGLGDHSRAPHRCPHKITDAVATLICGARRQHPSWGPELAAQACPPPNRDILVTKLSWRAYELMIRLLNEPALACGSSDREEVYRLMC